MNKFITPSGINRYIMTDYLNKEIHVGDTCVFASMAGILHTGKIVGFRGNSVEIGSCNHQGYFEWYVNPKSIAIVTE